MRQVVIILTYFSILITNGFAPLSAGIIRTTQMSDVTSIIESLDYPANEVLFVFDVDDVIITPKDEVLQSQNRSVSDPLIKAIVKRRLQKNEAKSRDELRWDLVTDFALQGERTLVDSSFLSLQARLRQQGIRNIALTACGTGNLGRISQLEEWRLADLKKFDVAFSWSFPEIEHFWLPEKTAKKGPALFYRGVVFAAKQNKGEVLEAVLNRLAYRPRCIVFVDDKKKNLLAMQQSCERLGIEYHGYHFKEMAERLPSSKLAERACLQFSVLEKEGRWLSDCEANKLLSTLPKI